MMPADTIQNLRCSTKPQNTGPAARKKRRTIGSRSCRSRAAHGAARDTYRCQCGTGRLVRARPDHGDPAEEDRRFNGKRMTALVAETCPGRMDAAEILTMRKPSSPEIQGRRQGSRQVLRNGWPAQPSGRATATAVHTRMVVRHVRFRRTARLPPALPLLRIGSPLAPSPRLLNRPTDGWAPPRPVRATRSTLASSVKRSSACGYSVWRARRPVGGREGALEFDPQHHPATGRTYECLPVARRNRPRF